MDILIPVLLIAFVIYLFVMLRKVGEERREAIRLLLEEQDPEKFFGLAETRRQKFFRPTMEYLDLLAKGAFVYGQWEKLEILVKEMDKVASPRQMDYLAGMHQFWLFLVKGEIDSAKKAYDFVLQTAPNKEKEPVRSFLIAYDEILKEGKEGLFGVEERFLLSDELVLPAEKAWLAYYYCNFANKEANFKVWENYQTYALASNRFVLLEDGTLAFAK